MSARTHGRIRADVVFTTSADGKNPSAGLTRTREDVWTKRTSGR
jgi:hypothetical protein